MSNNQLLTEVRQFLSEKNFDKVNEIFLEKLIENRNDLETLYLISDELRKRANGAVRASDLLLTAIEEFGKAGEWDYVLKVTDKITSYYIKYDKHRDFVIKAYKNLYSDISDFDNYIKYSGLNDKNVYIKDAIEKLNLYIKYTPGKYFYFERFGFGETKEINFELNKIILDFEKQKNYSVEFRIAENILKPITKDHFLYIKFKNPEKIKQMLETSQEELLILILKSANKELKATEIKSLLEGVASKADIEKFWKTAQTIAKKNKNIKISLTSPKTYKYVENKEEIDKDVIQLFDNSPIDKKVEIYRKANVNNEETKEYFKNVLLGILREEMKKESPRSIELYFNIESKVIPEDIKAHFKSILQDKDKLAETIKSVKIPETTTKILNFIKANFDNWIELYQEIFFFISENKYYDYILNDLIKANQSDVIKKMINNFIENYGKYPHQFLWFVRKAMAYEDFKDYLNFNLLYKLLEMIVFFNEPSVWKKSVSTLSANNFLFVEKCVVNSTTEEMRKLINFLNSITKLDNYQKKEILSIIRVRFPQLFKQEKEQTFFALSTTIEKKRRELEHIVEVELPKNSKDIATAREHGDLRENYEYKAAREKQRLLSAKVNEIDRQLKKVRAINLDKISDDKVGIGTVLTLKDLKTNDIKKITILGPWEADSDKNIFSYIAPAIQKIIGKKVNDKISLGEDEYIIEKIEKVNEEDFGF